MRWRIPAPVTLPCRLAWKEQSGAFSFEEAVELQTATQEIVKGTVCDPARIKVEGFRALSNEVLFLNMHPDNGEYELLLGYIVLEQYGAAVDVLVPGLLLASCTDMEKVKKEHV